MPHTKPAAPAKNTGGSDAMLSLERLLTDEAFVQLQGMFYRMNLYDVCGMNSHEIKHSNTLAWFFDPNGSHKLGALFFQKFMTHLFEENQAYFTDKNINILNVLLNDFQDAEAVRESESNIDILFKSKIHKFALCIENKINAELSPDQLDKYYNYIESAYKGFTKVYVLLSPYEEVQPNDECKSSDEWLVCSYNTIVDILRSIIEQDVDSKLKNLIEDYIKLLEKERIVENAELNETLANIYHKHKAAIDLLADYRAENSDAVAVAVIRQVLEGLEKSEKIKLTHQSFGKPIRFFTKRMDEFLPRLDNPENGSWTKGEGEAYRYWFFNESKTMLLVFELGPQGQSPETLAKMNKIMFAVKKDKLMPEGFIPSPYRPIEGGIYRCVGKLYIDIDFSDSTPEISRALKDAIQKILDWEEALLNAVDRHEVTKTGDAK